MPSYVVDKKYCVQSSSWIYFSTITASGCVNNVRPIWYDWHCSCRVFTFIICRVICRKHDKLISFIPLLLPLCLLTHTEDLWYPEWLDGKSICFFHWLIIKGGPELIVITYRIFCLHFTCGNYYYYFNVYSECVLLSLLIICVLLSQSEYTRMGVTKQKIIFFHNFKNKLCIKKLLIKKEISRENHYKRYFHAIVTTKEEVVKEFVKLRSWLQFCRKTKFDRRKITVRPQFYKFKHYPSIVLRGH